LRFLDGLRRAKTANGSLAFSRPCFSPASDRGPAKPAAEEYGWRFATARCRRPVSARDRAMRNILRIGPRARTVDGRRRRASTVAACAWDRDRIVAMGNCACRTCVKRPSTGAPSAFECGNGSFGLPRKVSGSVGFASSDPDLNPLLLEQIGLVLRANMLRVGRSAQSPNCIREQERNCRDSNPFPFGAFRFGS